MTYGITNAGGGKSADLGTKSITSNDTYLASDDGLDGYSEVTVNVQTAPTLQSKIARQNGTVTADDGYDGLSSVDVGVGQIGQSYSCANKTGNAIAQYDKVWLTYREVQPSQSVYAQPIYDYENTIAFVANNQQTGLLYKQSNNNGNLFNLLDFTVDSLSSLALFNNQYSSFANQVGDKYIFQHSGSSPVTWVLDTSAQTMVVWSSGAYVDYVTGFYTHYNRYSSSLFDPNGVAHDLPAGYNGMPGSGFCLYGYVKNGTTYMWYKDYNSGQHVCSVDMNTYNLTHVANMAGGTGLHITNKTSDSEYLMDCTCAREYSSRSAFRIISTTTYGDVTDSVLPLSWAGISSTPAVVQFDERTGILIAINAPLTSGNTLNLQDVKLAKYNTSTKVFDDITATVNLPNYDFYTNSSNYYGINFWLSSDYTNFAICYRTSKSYGQPGVENTLTVLQLTPADGWVISSINYDALTGYAAANIAAGATGNVIVGERIDGTSITATNNSSYARENGEKVWLYANNGSYTIVDALGLTSNAFTGVCKEAIAIGASGAVQATVGGNLVVRWTRDFSVAGGPSIDDNARIVTFTGDYQGVYKVFAIGTSTPTTSVTIQLKSKFTGSGSNHNQSYPFSVFGTSYGSYANVEYPLIQLINTKGLYYKISESIGNIGTQEKTLLTNSAWVNGKWYWIKVEVTDTLVSSYWSEDGTTWNAGPTISGNGILASFANRTTFGFRSFYDNTTWNGTVDMNESWVKVDGDIVWQPYAPITE